MSRVAAGALLATFAAFSVQAMSPGIDGDGDGKASFAELQAIYPGLTKKLFAEIDANADGFVDDEEMAEAIAAGNLIDEVTDS